MEKGTKMKNKTRAFFKELLFCGITVGVGFHLHYQITGDKKESTEQMTVATPQTHDTDTTTVAFNKFSHIKSNFEKTR